MATQSAAISLQESRTAFRHSRLVYERRPVRSILGPRLASRWEPEHMLFFPSYRRCDRPIVQPVIVEKLYVARKHNPAGVCMQFPSRSCAPTNILLSP